MPEPLEITVGPYTVAIDHFEQIKVRLSESASVLTVPRGEGTHTLIADLARALADARRDSKRVVALLEEVAKARPDHGLQPGSENHCRYIITGKVRGEAVDLLCELRAAQQPAREEA